MTHTTNSLRYAGTAIAAALAITSTRGFAQDSAAPFPTPPPVAPAPEIVVPDIPVPAAPEPTLVLPTEPLEPVTADDAAVESPTTEAQPVPARTRITPSTERAAPAPAPMMASPAPAAPAPAPAPKAESKGLSLFGRYRALTKKSEEAPRMDSAPKVEKASPAINISVGPADRMVSSQSDEELEIPAFLRRQAN